MEPGCDEHVLQPTITLLPEGQAGKPVTGSLPTASLRMGHGARSVPDTGPYGIGAYPAHQLLLGSRTVLQACVQPAGVTTTEPGSGETKQKSKEKQQPVEEPEEDDVRTRDEKQKRKDTKQLLCPFHLRGLLGMKTPNSGKPGSAGSLDRSAPKGTSRASGRSRRRKPSYPQPNGRARTS